MTCPRYPLLMLVLGCSSELFTPETNPCQLYETAVNDCADDALRYLEDTGDVVEYTIDLDCPAEEALTQAEFNYYDCLHGLWDAADCTTAAGMLDMALAAAECETPDGLSPASSGPQ